MKKSDLRTGMLVTLRNGESYYAMIGTGLSGRQEDILVHKVGKELGWMPLCSYLDDLTYYDNDPDPVIPPARRDDPDWDIVQVQHVRIAPCLFNPECYRTIWTRDDT